MLDAVERRVLAPENVRLLLDDTLDALANSDEDEAAAERERLSHQVAELDRKIRHAALPTRKDVPVLDEGGV